MGKIALDRLLAVEYQHPSLATAERFFKDFGLHPVEQKDGKIFFRGFGPDPYCYVAAQSPDSNRHFVGGIWLVKSAQDLETAAAEPGASEIEDAVTPGGGKQVELHDPLGFTVRLVHGVEMRPQADVQDEAPADVKINSWVEKNRKGEFQRFRKGPSNVFKCGHYGIEADDSQFEGVVAWYLDTMGLTVTDTIYHGDTGKDFMVFMHLEKGKEFVDHHSFFLIRSMKPLPKPHPHHTSFELDNFDSHQIGHDHLVKKGWTNAWGVGRHKLGSQIFDYWFDCSGNIVEHYSDGDLVNEDTEAGRELATPESMSIWGPSASKAFLTGRVEDAVVTNLPVEATA